MRRTPIVALAWAAGACAPGGGVSGPTPTAGDGYARIVAPFSVLDSAGAAYAHPFLGGLNVPRPQLVDIDGDGDLDLFVQEMTGQVMLFERVSAADGVRFVWRTDRWNDLDVGEWYRFGDMDADGDVDLLTEERFSHIRYYRNDGTLTDPAFTLAVDSLRDAEGEPLFSDRQNIPNVTDIDCDERLDLFVGQLVGTVSRYEATGPGDPRGVPRFRLVTDRFEDIEIVTQIGSRHGANTLTFADVDSDGDEDLFWGDFFEPGLLFIENTGSCRAPNLRGEPIPFPPADPLATSGYNAPAFGDVDGDGDQDLVVGVLGGAYNPNRTSRENLYYLEREESGAYALQTRRFLTMLDVGSESLPSLVDLDGDGDLDLLLANKIDPGDLQTSRIYRFVNEGTPRRPVFRAAGTLEFSGHYHFAPAFGDLDGDGDQDLLLGTWRDELRYYVNEGTVDEPRFVLRDSALVELTRGTNATPALVDIDADGDLDLFVGEGSGTLNYYRNVGSATAPAYELVSDEYLDLDVGRRSVPAFSDLDGDGDQDLILGRDTGGLLRYRNTGTPEAPVFVEDGTLELPLVPDLATPIFADIDGDGDQDLFIGGLGGGVVYYEHQGR